MPSPVRRPLSVLQNYGSSPFKMQETDKKKLIAFSSDKWNGRALSEPARFPLPPKTGQAAITLLMKRSTTSRNRVA